MWIESIDIEGFGCLVNRHYEFPRDKVVLIVDENEQGKSTLVAAVLAGLCGFPTRRSSGNTIRPVDVYRPWSGGPYRVKLCLEAGGSRYCVERDFNRNTFVVRDLFTNVDISRNFSTDLASDFLRLPREDYKRIAVISGKEVSLFDSSPTIRERLTAVVEGSENSVGAEVALDRLQEARYRFEGAEIQPETAIKRIRDQITQREHTLYELDRKLEEADRDVQQLDELRRKRRELEEKIRELDREYELSRLSEVRERIAVAERDRQKHSELLEELRNLEQYASFPVKQADQDSLIRIRSTLESISQARASLEEAREKCEAVKRDWVSRVRKSSFPLGALSVVLLLVGLFGRALNYSSITTAAVVGLAVIIAAGAVFLYRGKSVQDEARVHLGQAERTFEQIADAAILRLRDLGVEADEKSDLVSILSSTGDRLEKHLEYRRLEKELLSLEERLLNDSEFAGLREEEKKLSERVGTQTIPDSCRQPSEIDRERQEAREESSQLGEEISELERRIGGVVENYRSNYSATREELETLRSELRKVGMFRDALALAGEVLKEVALELRRRWADVLNDRASPILSHLNPDYNDLRFDESLNFTVCHVDSDRVIQKNEIDSCLSTGAKDQIYLSVRLACCLALSANGESVPIILDDVFISFDDDRFERGFRYIVEEIPGDQQVIMLTCHRARHQRFEQEEWFRERVHLVGMD